MIWRILQIEVCVMRLIGIIQSLCAFSTRPLIVVEIDSNSNDY